MRVQVLGAESPAEGLDERVVGRLSRSAEVKAVDDGTEVTTRYPWLGQSILAELDDAKDTLRRYVQGPGIDQPVAMIDYSGSNPETQYCHADHAGSIVAMSNAAGTHVDTHSYSAEGEVGEEGVEGSPFRFTDG